MKFKSFSSLIVMIVSAFSMLPAVATTIPTYISAAVIYQGRPAADTQTDAERKSAELLAFAGIKPGDKIADLIPGTGYFTRLFRQVVGAHGHVFAVVPDSLAAANAKRLDPINELIAGPGYKNVTLLVRPYAEIGADTPLDIVWTSQNYHDIYGEVGSFVESGTSGEAAAAKLDAAAFTALKPGGIFIVIDHAAKAGAGGNDAKTLHRIDVDTVVAQVTAAGFVLEARSNLLANAQDPHDKIIFAPEIRGHTDKFVLKFRKPNH